jgi:hypothetical protein
MFILLGRLITVRVIISLWVPIAQLILLYINGLRRRQVAIDILIKVHGLIISLALEFQEI